jgi:hypothetical protein
MSEHLDEDYILVYIPESGNRVDRRVRLIGDDGYQRNRAERSRVCEITCDALLILLGRTRT